MLSNLTRCRPRPPQLLRGSLARSVRDASPPPPATATSRDLRLAGPCRATTRPCSRPARLFRPDGSSCGGDASPPLLAAAISRDLQTAGPCHASARPIARRRGGRARARVGGKAHVRSAGSGLRFWNGCARARGMALIVVTQESVLHCARAQGMM